jgi:hypothetical protein
MKIASRKMAAAQFLAASARPPMIPSSRCHKAI